MDGLSRRVLETGWERYFVLTETNTSPGARNY